MISKEINNYCPNCIIGNSFLLYTRYVCSPTSYTYDKDGNLLKKIKARYDVIHTYQCTNCHHIFENTEPMDLGSTTAC